MSKVFSTHPMTDDCIAAAQKNIAENLKARPEYVLNSSEFNGVKERLAMMHNHRPDTKKDDSSRPTLRRNPNGTVEDENDDKKAPKDQDERPTLKRREN
jgi:hypothetical protein